MSRPLLAALLALGVSLAGCASAYDEGSPFSDGGGDRPRSVRLEVLNLNFNDARLYALRDAERLSLGTVGGKQEGTFTIPWGMSQELRIEINLLAGPTCTTEALGVQPGDILELQIQSVFSNSSFCR